MNNRYNVPSTVVGHALAISSQKNTPSVKLVLRANDDQPRNLYKDLWLSDNAFDGSIKVLREVLGWQGMDLQELNAQPAILSGIEVVAVCEVEEYEGPNGEPREREVVAFINDPNAQGGAKPLEAAQAANLARSLNARLAALGRASGSARPAAGSPPVGGRQSRLRPNLESGERELPPFAPPSDDLPY
jgi:hypothetical protein